MKDKRMQFETILEIDKSPSTADQKVQVAL